MRTTLLILLFISVPLLVFCQDNSSKYFSLTENYSLESNEEKYDARNGDMIHHFYYKSKTENIGVYIQVTNHKTYTEKHFKFLELDAKNSGQTDWRYIRFKNLKAFQLKAKVGSNTAILTTVINNGRLFTITVVSDNKALADKTQAALNQDLKFKTF